MSLVPQDYEPIQVRLGDISVSQSRVQTPYGAYPLAQTTWLVTNHTYVTESIPAWAIVLAIIFFVFCLLGLLFLLVKERRLYGAMQVSVQGPGLSYSTYIPVRHEMQIFQVNSSVDWIRAQVAHLPSV